jgi:N-methylhydantoinase B
MQENKRLMDSHIDPIELELFKHAVFTIADEMAVTVIRTSYSSVVRDNMDFSTAITDRHGQVVAQGLTIAGHLGSIPSALAAVTARYGDALKPSDVFLLNDPYSGGMHLPDIFIFMPIFDGDQLIAFAAAVCHHTDVGGRVAGSNAADSTEIYQEGLRIPPLRLYEGNRINETLEALIERNVRLPDNVMGDLRAQVAACRVAERNVLSLCNDMGSDKVMLFMNETMDYAERMTRQAISKLPDGVFEFEDWIDDDGVVPGRPIRLHVAFTKKDDSLSADWTGSAPQVKGAINSTLSYTSAATYCAVRSILEGDIPDNDGMCRAIEVVAPPGSIVNVLPPGACAARGLTGFRMLDCAFGALARMVPEKVFAASDGGVTGISFGGYREDRSPFVYVEFLSAAWGGRPEADGPDGISNLLSNLSLPSAEAIEAHHPVEVVCCEFVRDTAGAGRFRGGCSLRRQLRFLEKEGTLQMRADRQTFPPYGLSGGHAGTFSRNTITSGETIRVLPGKVTVPIYQDDIITHETAGAGGWGEPLERDPEAVLRDVRDDLFSTPFARNVFGVVIDRDRWMVDVDATKTRRKEIFAAKELNGD